MQAFGRNPVTQAHDLNKYRMSNKAYRMTKFDALEKSHQSRHPGPSTSLRINSSRGPELLVFPGFRLSPE
jgi:hypothetical protein